MDYSWVPALVFSVTLATVLVVGFKLAYRKPR